MSPFKKGVLSLLILVLSALPSQGNEVMSSPVIRNFTPSDYHGGRQNRSVSQSASGLIYVGNNQYLLEYDGHSWNRYLMPNKVSSDRFLRILTEKSTVAPLKNSVIS